MIKLNDAMGRFKVTNEPTKATKNEIGDKTKLI